MTRAATATAAPVAPVHAPPPVVHEQDPSELEADRAAETALRGGSVAGWSFSAVRPVPPPAPPDPTAGSEWTKALGTGRSLEPGTRRGFERRFGYDFSRVRVHDDARAARVAAEMSAVAFTSGDDVVFARDRYRPHVPAGRHLIAHELAHVVQQGRAPRGSGAIVQRRSFLGDVAIFFGLSEGDFTRDELRDYLNKVTVADHIEDDFDSDNKARAVVRHYQTGTLWFDLTPRQKVLMIKEMLSGPTMAEDEEEIVALLEVSDDDHLDAMFGTGGLTVDELESDIGGVSGERLALFFAGRFVGGRAALLAGRVQARGFPPRVFDEVVFNAMIDAAAPSSLSEADLAGARVAAGRAGLAIAQAILQLPPIVRERATRWLAGRRADLDRQSVDLGRQVDGAADQPAREALRATQRGVDVRRHSVDVGLQNLYRDVARGNTRFMLRERTAAPFDTPQQRARIHASTAPEVRVDPQTGRQAEFVSQLPGEPLNYEQKLRNLLGDIITRHYNDKVVGKGDAERLDPTRMHRLADMECIANRAKAETDRVFGHLAHSPAMRADTPTRRGNIHDLFAEYEARLQHPDMTPEIRRQQAQVHVRYFLSTDGDIRRLNDRHTASPTPATDAQGRPNPVAGIHERLVVEFTDTPEEVTRIHHIWRGWTATAGGGHINIQLWRAATPERDRLYLWDIFQTMIHEYMHTLVHDDYRAYALSLGHNTARYITLMEGVDTLLSETVWADVAPRVTDPGLRLAVEGQRYAALPPLPHVPHPEFVRRYPAYAEAVRLTQLVGIANIYAAYFLGDVEKIRT